MAQMFSIFLVILTVVTGLIWLVDSLIFAPKRRERAALAAGVSEIEGFEPPLPYAVDTAKQIFPVIAFVMIMRSFIYEPFQIPSGSMMPTLLVGDFILVEKFSYGLRDPITRTKFLEVGEPQRGDIVVKLGTIDTPDMMSYMKALASFEEGATTTVTINRNGEIIEREVTF